MMPPLVLLAGGLATRLYPLTQTIPKSMMLVAGKPFIDYQLSLLKSKGITKVILCIGHFGEQICEYVGDGSQWGMQVEYSFDGEILAGTGGALRKALPLLDDVFFVMYGDSYLDIDFLAVAQEYFRQGSLGLMTVFKNQNQWDTSNIVYHNGKIVKYSKKEQTDAMQYIDYGLALLCKKVVAEIPLAQHYDLAQLYQNIIHREQMAGFEVKTRFYEIGSHVGLKETEEYLRNRN